MVVPAADAHRVLLQDAQARRGLAGVQQAGVRALQGGGHLPRAGGDAAHALQEVQRHALAGEQHADVAPHAAQELAAAHRVPVLAEEGHLRPLVQQGEHAREHVQPGDDAVLLGQQLHLARRLLADDGVRAHVLIRNILPQRREQQRIDLRFHRDGIHLVSFLSPPLVGGAEACSQYIRGRFALSSGHKKTPWEGNPPQGAQTNAKLALGELGRATGGLQAVLQSSER